MGQRGPGANRLAAAAKRDTAGTLFEGSGWNPGTGRPQVDRAWNAPGLSRAARVIAFVESLPITKGFGAGAPVQLEPFQRAFIEAVYATDAADLRTIRMALLSMARGNGKSALLAMLCLAHLVGPEAEPRGECYSAAATKDQAAIIFSEMEAIIEAVPWMAARCNVQRFGKKIEDLETKSVYRALASDGASLHGLAPSFVVCDELAQWKGRELFEVLRTSMLKRREPLLVILGTQSPSPTNLMSELVDHAERINRGEVDDPSFYGRVFAAPEDCALDDPEAWAAANPALGRFVSAEHLAIEAKRSIRMPGLESAFRNLHLNQRVDAEPKAINPAEWEACGGAVDIEALRGRPCYGGLDLASVRDLAALVLYFPEDGGAIVAYHWTPKDGLSAKEESDRVPYRLWAKNGLLEATPGAAIDKTFIAHRMAAAAELFDLRGIAFDRHMMKDLKVILGREGVELPLVDWGQGYVSMAPAVNAFETALVSRQLRHGMSPILRWQASNLIFETDAAGNRKPSKHRSIDRIDGMVSLIMAIGLAARDDRQEHGADIIFL